MTGILNTLTRRVPEAEPAQAQFVLIISNTSFR